jgi:hypothetical protein
MTRYAQRSLIQQPTVSNWGKAAPTGIGVVAGYGLASGGTSSSITAGGNPYTLLSFTVDGTLTVATAGLFDCLVVGGGGGQGYSAGPIGGGGGGGVIRSTYFIPAGTYAVTVAAGQGSGGASGFGSSIQNVAYVGGGGGSNGHATPTGQQGAINAGGVGGFNNGSNVSNMKGLTSTIYGGGFDSGANSGGTGGNGGGGGGAGGAGSGANGGTGVDQSDFFGNSAGTNRFGAGGGSSSGSDGAGNGANNSGGGAKHATHSGYTGAVYVRFRV